MKSRVFLAALVAAVWLAAAGLASADDVKWYTDDEFDKAVELATKSGRPIAVMWQETASTCPLHNAQRQQWKNMTALQNFVCIMLDTEKTKTFPPVFGKIYSAGEKKKGKFIPMLFLGTVEGECLDVIPYETSAADATRMVKAALKRYGPIPTLAQAAALWRKLESARKLLEEKKIGQAMALYQELKAVEKANPNLPICKELKADEGKINERGKELIERLQNLVKEGKTDEARAGAVEVAQTFKGFETAKDAEALLKEIPAPGK